MRLIAGFATLLVCLLLFGAIAEDIAEQEANTLDGVATPFLHGLANPPLDTLMRGLTTMGSTPVVISLFVLAMMLLVWRHHRREALFLTVAIGGSVILDQVLKLIFHRPRPQLAWSQVQPEYSFPSGHSMNSLVFYLALAVIVGSLWSRRAGLIASILAIGLAVLIGTSRILPRVSLLHGRPGRPAGRRVMAPDRRLGIRHGDHGPATAILGRSAVTTRAFVIGRRRKGRHIGRIVREVQAALEAAGWTVDSELVDERSALIRRTRRAIAQGFEVAVAVGGDGAVHQVVTAVAGTSAALGIIPAGTGNLLAGNLGIPHDVAKAAQVDPDRHPAADRHRTGDRRRQEVRPGGRLRIGFDADVMKATGNAAKRRFGKLAYFASAAVTSGRIRNIRHDITIDGVTMHTKAAQVFVANLGRMGPGLAPRRAVLPDDGLLEVIVVRASGAIPALGAAWEALRRTELGEAPSGRVFRGQATRVRIATSRPRLVEVDGNVVGHTPVDVRVVPAGLVVIVPVHG